MSSESECHTGLAGRSTCLKLAVGLPLRIQRSYPVGRFARQTIEISSVGLRHGWGQSTTGTEPAT